MQKFEQLKNKEEKIKELKEKWDAAHEKDALDAYNKCTNFAQELLKKYPDARDYRLFHILIGSSVDREMEKFDFPGDDSVEQFINSL